MAAVDRLHEHRIIELDREVVPALLAALLPCGAEIDIAGPARTDDTIAGSFVALGLDRLERDLQAASVRVATSPVWVSWALLYMK